MWWGRWRRAGPGSACTECYCGPLPLPFGGGLGRSAHGPLPLPGPATLQILAAVGAPIRPRATDRELVTPTGAALVATLCRFAQPPLPLQRVGVGYGTRRLPWPNALRLILGEPIERPIHIQSESEIMAPDCRRWRWRKTLSPCWKPTWTT